MKLEFVVETDHVGGVEFRAKGADKSMLDSSHGCAQGEYRNIYSITVMAYNGVSVNITQLCDNRKLSSLYRMAKCVCSV